MQPFPPTDTPDTLDNPAVGIDQSLGDFTYDVKYDYDAGSGLS